MKIKTFCLGKSPVRKDKRTLSLTNYLTKLPPAPPSANWGTKVLSWLMLGNDTVGDCTCACAGHLNMLWASFTKAFAPTTAQILAAYSAITGYNPADPSSDTGANVLDVLNYWRKHGIAGKKIFAFVEMKSRAQKTVSAAVNLFGGIYIGVQLPQSAMDDFNAGKPWTRLTGKILGGHAIPIVAYDATGLTCVTWGREQKMSWAWFAKYCDEAYCVLDTDWAGNNAAPSGFNIAQLQADLAALNSAPAVTPKVTMADLNEDEPSTPPVPYDGAFYGQW